MSVTCSKATWHEMPQCLHRKQTRVSGLKLLESCCLSAAKQPAGPVKED